MLLRLDLALLRLLRTRGHAPAIERAVVLLTRAAEHALLWYVLAVLLALLDPLRRPLYRRAMRAVLAAQVANFLVKTGIRRARPVLEELPALVPVVYGRSYPSAHAATSFAAARVLSGALPRMPLYLLAGAVALSRPYVGVHYPSDALAGAALGDAMARLTP